MLAHEVRVTVQRHESLGETTQLGQYIHVSPDGDILRAMSILNPFGALDPELATYGESVLQRHGSFSGNDIDFNRFPDGGRR